MSQAEFRKAYKIDAASQIKLNKILFMKYQHPDLQEISTFLKGTYLIDFYRLRTDLVTPIDFGLFKVKETGTDVWFRGYGADQYVYHVHKGPAKFLGGAFEAESLDQLVRFVTVTKSCCKHLALTHAKQSHTDRGHQNPERGH